MHRNVSVFKTKLNQCKQGLKYDSFVCNPGTLISFFYNYSLATKTVDILQAH